MRCIYFISEKNAQPVTMLLKTGLNNILLPILFLVVNNIVQAEQYNILFKLVFINMHVTGWAFFARSNYAHALCKMYFI